MPLDVGESIAPHTLLDHGPSGRAGVYWALKAVITPGHPMRRRARVLRQTPSPSSGPIL